MYVHSNFYFKITSRKKSFVKCYMKNMCSCAHRKRSRPPSKMCHKPASVRHIGIFMPNCGELIKKRFTYILIEEILTISNYKQSDKVP